MVTLKNITKTENDISADYYIEDNHAKGFIRVSIQDGKVIEHENAGYGSSHAVSELRRLAKLYNPPTEKTVLWY